MKKIYIVLTYTGTVISKMIKKYTKDEFCHSSIALDRGLNEMYSFGRIYTFTPLIAGFVHENIHSGTFKKFYKTQAKVYAMKVTDEQYEKVKNILEEFKSQNKKYKFNMIGLCAAGINKKVHLKNYFYCAEFLKYVLDKAEIQTNLPEVVKPEHFKNIEGLEEIYSGLLRKYNKTKIKKFAKNVMLYTKVKPAI